jgi:hypothetical protein
VSEVPSLLLDYYRRCVPDPPAEPRGTVFEQTGEIKLDPARPWTPFAAEQTHSAERVEFVWRARFKMAPLVTGVVEDAYEDGAGRLDAKLWSLVRIAHARGPEVDRGEAQRYLAELAWCPMAIVHNDELEFAQTADDVVRVWAGDEETYVDLAFDSNGDIAGARAVRPRDPDLTPWEGRFTHYRDFGGIRAPSKGEVHWELEDGPFVYWRAEITSLRWAG